MDASDLPPIPHGMNDELFKAGIKVLQSLLNTPGQSESMHHVESILNTSGVDAALYLLYYGFRAKEYLYGSSILNEPIRQAEFKLLLQTAASIGAHMSREKLVDVNKIDRMWDIPSIFTEEGLDLEKPGD